MVRRATDRDRPKSWISQCGKAFAGNTPGKAHEKTCEKCLAILRSELPEGAIAIYFQDYATGESVRGKS